jgi:S1-C subfamily serine protease
MTDSDNDFDTLRRPRPASEPGPGVAATTAPGTQRQWPRGQRALVASAFAALALGIGAAGALVGHEFWGGPGGSAVVASGVVGSGGQFTPYQSQSPSNGGFYGADGTSGLAASAPSNLAAIAAKVDPALVDINSTFTYQSSEGAGTGIVLSSNGEILTNNHVIDGATKITATDVGNGKTYTATVVGYDPSHDIAVLQLQGASGLQTASLGNSSDVAVGASVVALGNAGGTGGTPSSAGGSVTAVNASITAGDELTGGSEQLQGLIETSAALEPGDSGGSLVNSAGDVVGMDTAASSGFSFTNDSGQGYAIPINEALAVAKQIESGKASADVHVGQTAFLGVLISGATQETPGFSGGFGIGGGFSNPGSGTGSTVSGAPVSGVIGGTPAQKSGLTTGDVITSFDKTTITSASTLGKLILGLHPGEKISLGWTDTSGQSHTGSVALASGPPA